MNLLRFVHILVIILIFQVYLFTNCYVLHNVYAKVIIKLSIVGNPQPDLTPNILQRPPVGQLPEKSSFRWNKRL